MKVALYIRVSTGDQNADMQRRELTEYAERHKWEIVTPVYWDCVSGVRAVRRGLGELMEAARARQFDAVLVWALDRFGRSLVDCCRLIQEFDRLGIRFICANQNIDTDQRSPEARLLLQLLAAFAEFEHSIIRERVVSGQRRYKQDLEAGRVGADVHSHSGKDLPPHRPRMVFDRARVITLREEGKSIRAIGKLLGVSKGTVERTLRQGIVPKADS